MNETFVESASVRSLEVVNSSNQKNTTLRSGQKLLNDFLNKLDDQDINNQVRFNPMITATHSRSNSLEDLLK